MDDCIFCRIVNGVETASIVYSDDEVLAFMDITPVNPGHLLVIPKVHAAQLSELALETGAHMFKVAMQIAEALRRSGIKCEGIDLFLADGEAAFQEIFHVHLYVIPGFRGDGFGLKPWQRCVCADNNAADDSSDFLSTFSYLFYIILI